MMTAQERKQLLWAALEKTTRGFHWEKPGLLAAGALATEFGWSRNLVSQYLNEFYEEGRAVKVNSRPVYFFSREALEQRESAALDELAFPSLEALQEALAAGRKTGSPFENLIGAEGSLSACVKQCKAALSYPGSGLPILLQGPTGTGKSMMARLLFDYGKQSGILPEKGRFVAVNCSEYANNPELLLTNLFGYKKGAYTGADQDRQGLLALANEGMLFLDEVHCLKAECQEKLFLFMDQGTYHMVGDNETWYHSKVRLIFATTERTDGVLLKTFLRRIPLISIIPALSERPAAEKKELVFRLLEQEAKKIGREIRISQLVYQALSAYDFPENVGQLVNCIRAAVANGLLRTKGENIPLELRLPDLPDNLFQEEPFRQSLTPYSDKTMLDLYWIREGAGSGNKCGRLNRELLELYQKQGDALNWEEFLASCRAKLEHYRDFLFLQPLSSGQEKFLLGLIRHLCGILSEKYGLHFSNNDQVCLAKLVQDLQRSEAALRTVERKSAPALSGFLGQLRDRFRREYSAASEFSRLLEDSLNLRIEGAGLLDLFLLFYTMAEKSQPAQWRGIILAQGYSTASSMADTVNRLLGQPVFCGIDKPVETHSSVLYGRLTEILREREDCTEAVILCDLLSLDPLAACLESLPDLNLVLLGNISAPLALETGRLLLEGLPAAEAVRKAAESAGRHETRLIQNRKKLPAILTVCSTGIGTAEKMADLLRQSLPQRLELQILPYEYHHLLTMGTQCPLFEKYQVLFIVGTTDPQLPGIEFIPLEKVMEDENVLWAESLLGGLLTDEEITAFRWELVRNFSLQNLLNHLTILNPEKIVGHVSEIIESIRSEMKLNLSNRTMIGLYIHISCLIERLITDRYISTYANLEAFTAQHTDFIQAVRRAFSRLEQDYRVQIPISEIGYLYEYIEQSSNN